jgi:uncharacterized protein (TIGR00255 family)
MTGFSSAIITLPIVDARTGTVHDAQVSVTLKTLNSRFFETSCRLPSSLSSLETELIKYFKQEFIRGTIHFTLYMSSPSGLTGTIEPSLSTVRAYIGALESIKKACNIQGDIRVSDLLTLPNIFETKETSLSQTTIEYLWKEIHALTKKCNEARILEGTSVEQDLRERLEILRKLITTLEPRALEAMALKKKQLLDNLRTLLSDISSELTAESQISAIYNQLERMAIHEEISRFNTHLTTLDKILTSSEISHGKKLDFTLQELFRETNTIASKCNDAIISDLAISIKVELEKAREQAQNIV